MAGTAVNVIQYASPHCESSESVGWGQRDELRGYNDGHFLLLELVLSNSSNNTRFLRRRKFQVCSDRELH